MLKNYFKWPYIGAIVATALMIYMTIHAEDLRFFEILCIAQLSFLMFHQFEEYAYPGGFTKFYNEEIVHISSIFNYPLTRKGVLWVNVYLGWTIFILAILFFDKHPWLGTGLAGVLLMNGLLHIALWILIKKYNPGLITAIFLFVPLGILSISQANQYLTEMEKLYSLLTFFIGTIGIPLTIKFSQTK